MISFRTTDDWDCEVEITVGGGGDTYTNAVTDNSAHDFWVAFLAWLNDAGRPWAGAATFSLGTYYPDEGGYGYTLRCTVAFDIIPDANAYDRMKWAADAGVTHVPVDGRATGTWLPAVFAGGAYIPAGAAGMRGFVRHLEGEGEGCGVGSARTGVAGLSGRSPSVEALANRYQAADLLAILAVAANPRQAWIYEAQTATWRLVSVGSVRMSAADPVISRVAFEVAG